MKGQYLVAFLHHVMCCDVLYDFCIKRCLVRLYLQLFVICLIYVSCVCLRVVVSNAYCVVFLFCFSSSVPYVANFSWLSIFDCLFSIL